MNISRKVNITALFAVLCTLFVTVASSDTTVALRGRRNLANSDKVDIYRCDSENQRITSTISNKTEVLENAGLDVRICFQASSHAIANNLYILKVDDFTFTKDRTNGDLAAAGPTRQIPAIMRQKAVDHGIALSTDLTEVFCEPGAEICAITTRLTGYFFLTSGTIMGKGSVLMQRGSSGRRDLQQLDEFQDVYIELDFTGGGRSPMPPAKKRTIIIVSIVAALLLLCCCCGVGLCCVAGICCFAGKDKREEVDEENIEEVSVTMEQWAPTKKHKKGADDEDLSETESLEDDKYWDDDINLSEDENEPDENSVQIDNFDSEMIGAAAVPDQDTEEEKPKKKKSKRKSTSRRSSKIDKSYDEENFERSEPFDDVEEVVAVPDSPESPKKKKKKKKKRNSTSME